MAGIFDRLDPDQSAAVRLRANATVSAGAGSGKTTVLAARYLDLLFSSKAELRSILCLTFTRKAAAQMRSRVWKELTASDSEAAKAALARFPEATISTIDSFCGGILRSSAQRYGYPPNFRVDEDAARELAESEALRFLLRHREDPALAALFSQSGFVTVWRALFAELAHLYAVPVTRPGLDLRMIPERACRALVDLARTKLAELGSQRSLILALRAPTGTTATMIISIVRAFPADPEGLLGPATGEAGVAAARAADRAALARMPEAAAMVAEAKSLRLTVGNGEGAEAFKDAARLIREAAVAIDLAAEAARLRPLEDAAILLLADFVDELIAAKRHSGILSFRDVAEAAVDLLAKAPELRSYWKSRYRYIMVDEFQDDDELQKELVFLLAEQSERQDLGVPGASELAPDKLFFVGDDKQSIYRFRGADVSVFNRLGRELASAHAAAAGESGSLPAWPRLRRNYRSEPGLIDFFNTVFARVFPAEGSQDYEARFEEALPKEGNPGFEASVTLLLKPRKPAAPSGAAPARAAAAGEETSFRSTDEALAAGIVRHLQSLVEGCSLPLPVKDGSTRPATYDDIAILFRSSSKQYLIERFLRLLDIPYSAEAIHGLFLEAPANDLLSLLRLAAFPSDRAALAAWLRSPFVGLSGEGFVQTLAAQLPADETLRALPLEPQDSLRLGAGLELLSELRRRIDREPLARIVQWIWFEAGQRISILRDPGAHPFLEHFDYLHYLAIQSDAAGENLSGFLNRVGPLLGGTDKVEDEVTVPRESRGGIHLMTVHKSKGLEFPVVVLPWAESGGNPLKNDKPWYRSEEAGITLNLRDWTNPKAKTRNPFFERARQEENDREFAEIKRLFYVACTRAESHLILAALEPAKALSLKSFLSLAGVTLAQGGLLAGPENAGAKGIIDSKPEALRVRILPPLGETEYRRLRGMHRPRDLAGFAPAYLAAAPLDRSFASRLVAATAIGETAWAQDPRRELPGEALPASAIDTMATAGNAVTEARFGDLCHAVMEACLKKTGLDPEHPALLALPETAASLLLAEAWRFAQDFMASPTGQRVAAAGQLLMEKDVLVAVGKHVVRARIDLIAIDATGLLILDWKSGAERRPAEYEVQLALYRRAARALYPDRETRSALVWLRSGVTDELDADFGLEELERWAGTIGEGPPLHSPDIQLY
jgi:ATP-dependent helicase/nuclease subunit A